MKIKSAVWQGAHTVRKKLCQLVLFVQENAWQTGGAGKKGSYCGMDENLSGKGALHMWEEPLYLGTKRFRGSVLSGADCAAVFCPES